MITFDVPLHFVLTLVAGTILPLLVGLVTTRATSASVKAIALAGLAVATSLATELAAALRDGDEYNLGLALLTALGTFLVAVGLHYGFWKPTGVTSAAQNTLRTASPHDVGGYIPAGTTIVQNNTGHPTPVYPYSSDSKAGAAYHGAEPEDEGGPDHRAPGPAN